MMILRLCSTAALVAALLGAAQANAASYACHPRPPSQARPLLMQLTGESLVLRYTENATFVGILKERGRTLQFDRFRTRTPHGELGVSVDLSAKFTPGDNELSVLDAAGWPTEYSCGRIGGGL